ncbi:hypothetical protein F3Y22_tig00000340pilonHSYRG00452 [Hibiscus syriacus]|uniref:RNase H type-1 domain-containing protein n=1 Tax=Hibiscus syriacus TaxID=106335 RepID=A0A6A3D7Y3_HIBSY|nr:hypothetical protein F3Y22_tig00000340pilonHSYRG00452 [Hibiscus syriacus]
MSEPPCIKFFLASTCLNTDGTITNTDGRVSIGGVLRNSNGDMVAVFTKNVGITSILQAELWDIYEGILIACSLEIPKLWTQSDCQQVVELLDDGGRSTSNISLVRAIANLRQRAWETKVQWIPRSRNTIADKLAKLASWQHFSMTHFEHPPAELADLLHREAEATK